MDGLVADALSAKKEAQALGQFLKTAKAAAFVKEAKGMEGETVRSYVWTSGRTLHIQLYVRELEGFKDERLAGILMHWEFRNPSSQNIDEYAAVLTKEFRFTYDMPKANDDDDVTIRVQVLVEARVKSDSPSCHQVVIGYTEAKPQPIYKIVCDDEDDGPTTDNIPNATQVMADEIGMDDPTDAEIEESNK